MATAAEQGLELPRCRICGVALMPQSGVAFRIGPRVMFVTCEPHAALARNGLELAQRVAVRGLREFLREKTPNLFDAVQEAVELSRQRREEQGR